MVKKLDRNFYSRPTLTVARDLLGKYLVYSPPAEPGKCLTGKIVEVEAYGGEKDLASHASHGLTKRNQVMFGQAGHAYVYFTYGLFWLFNVVTEAEGRPGAVLIRALEPAEGIEEMVKNRGGGNGRHLTSGPAKITEAFGIDGKINGVDLCGNLIWLEDRGELVEKSQIVATKRIGIDYARKWKNKNWRFYLKGNKFVSKL